MHENNQCCMKSTGSVFWDNFSREHTSSPGRWTPLHNAWQTHLRSPGESPQSKLSRRHPLWHRGSLPHRCSGCRSHNGRGSTERKHQRVRQEKWEGACVLPVSVVTNACIYFILQNWSRFQPLTRFIFKWLCYVKSIQLHFEANARCRLGHSAIKCYAAVKHSELALWFIATYAHQ